MAESIADLQSRLERAMAPGFRARLLDKGLARGLIWRDGELPPGAPSFSISLTADLLDYAYAVMALSLRLRAQEAAAPTLERAFVVAGEAIEAAVHRGRGGSDKGFHRVSAAVAFHLARYSARAYSMLPTGDSTENLAPTENVLVQLLRRRLEEMHASFSEWLLDEKNTDEGVAGRLRDDIEFDETDATHLILVTSFMRGLALFDHAITTGDAESATAAKLQLNKTAETAGDLHAVSHWWTATLASHLIDELWQLSLHQQIPTLPDTDRDKEGWATLRRNYIQRLRAADRAAIELWPSQLAAAQRAVDPTDNLIVALPTSAGKTRIAELCILRSLAANQRVVYVTPLRSLSAQVERDLGKTFRPLGFSVSSLYGAAGVEKGDTEMLRDGKIVVSTPEKLDFALRNDPSIIDDVGIIVLDEGHMLGKNEREVRYEVLVQCLLRRNDADGRRIVCLSALFPSPEEMRDLVEWLRQDEPGEPVHSTWRPTRQRFGTLRWMSNVAGLDVKVGEERPFVPRFVEATDPPEGSRRRNQFPNDKNDLTLAAAWRFVEQEKEVLVYCPLRKSVETLGRRVLTCIRQGVLQPLRVSNDRVQNTMATGAEWLGADHPAVQCLQYGVALHHGGLPRPFLNEVERLLRSGDCLVTIASPTLAQGLNLSASVLLVPSIWRSQEIIPTKEFVNVAGRAGRAFVDLEGLVLHVVWETTPYKADCAVRNWEKLVDKTKVPQIQSGILQLAMMIYCRISRVVAVPVDEVVDYVTGHGDAWDYSDAAKDKLKIKAADWERDVASLDSAILALLDVETLDDDLASVLDGVLEGSLFSRQLARQGEKTQKLLRGFVTARAQRIWDKTLVPQRKGYHAAGIGLAAGQFIDANLGTLVSLLRQAESAVMSSNADDAATAVVSFAELVFQAAPFREPKDLPAKWKDALRVWMRGCPSAEVIGTCDNDGVDLLQEALMYRLPWAMEAVRVHASAVRHENADEITGIAALAVEAGSSNCSVIQLLRGGLSSREAAIVAVDSTSASFVDRPEMLTWLMSEKVQTLTEDESWPTEQSRHAWQQFVKGGAWGDRQHWTRAPQVVRVAWLDQAPESGAAVVIEPSENGKNHGLVLKPDFIPVGTLCAPLQRSGKDIVAAVVGAKANTVVIEYFGR